MLGTAGQPSPCPHPERHFDQASRGCSVLQSDQNCGYHDPLPLAGSLFDMYSKLGITEHENKGDVYNSAVDLTIVGSPVVASCCLPVNSCTQEPVHVKGHLKVHLDFCIGLRRTSGLYQL